MDGTTEQNDATRRSEDTGGRSATDWLVQKARLAVAVGVIKTRPAGLSGRQHTEALTHHQRSQDGGWRRRAEALKEEVLRLRQELLLVKMRARGAGLSEGAGGDDDTPDLPEMDSCCSMQSNMDNAPLPALNPQIVHPTVPYATPLSDSSGLLTSFPVSAQDGGRASSTLHSVNFLQNSCSLRRAGGSDGSPGATWFDPADDSSVMADTVLQLLGSVVGACKGNPPLLTSAPYLQACRTAAGTTDLWCSRRWPSTEFVTRAEELIEDLAGFLFRTDLLHRLPIGEKLTESLILLGASSFLGSLLVPHLLSLVNGLAERLWLSCQGEETSEPGQLEIHEYENSFYLFWILEQLLQRSEVPSREGWVSWVTRPSFTVELKAFLGNLENHVLLLSDEFPLFALYMWRIGAIISLSDGPETENTSR